ncbi:MAG: HEAT repeat domain-containing protein, partial [Deltaproteobacteria bacterium]|nr:HEAT repeat domain-containing protein [Deltaproteobacteria bacterium]
VIRSMARSASPVLRYWGVYLLGILGDKSDADKVASLLEDPVPNVRYTAAQALYRILKNESLNALVVRLTSDPNWYVRCRVYSLFLEAGMIPSPA